MIPLKVLFVEDDRVDQLAFERFVEEHGLPITYVLAGSLNEAKYLVTQGEFDVIVADYSLGDGTALDLLPFAAGVPLILITGVGDEEIAARAFTAGISDSLVKDIGRNYLEQLPERIEKAVGRRMRSVETLRENQALYRRVVDTANEGIWIADQDYNTSFVNRRMAHMLGYQPEEMVGQPIHHFLFPEDLADFTDRTGARGRTAPSQYEIRFRHKDGSTRWTIISTTATVNEQGEFRGSFAMVTDINERKQAEEALRENEVRYRELFENINSGVAVYTVIGNGQDFIFKDFNRAGERIDHDQRERLIGKSIFEVRPGVEQFGLIEVFRQVWQTGEPAVHPVTLYQDNKLSGWYENFVYKLPSGEIVAVFENITDRKRAEEELRESEERYRALFDRSLDCVYIHDFEGRFIDANDPTLNLLGYKREEIRGLNFASLLSEDQLPLAFKTLQEIRETGFQKGLTEYRLRLRNGNDLYVETKGSAILSKGTYTAIQSVARNITERKRAEEALQESEERYRRILDLSREGIWVLDEQFRTTFVNSYMSQWLGYPSEEIVGHPMEEFLFQEDIPDHQREMQERKMMIDSQYERRFQRKDGGVIWAIVSARALLRDDAFQGSFLMLTDLTERKKAEEALKESEEKYRLLIENQTDLVTKMDPEYRFLFVSPSYCKMFGKTEEELFGKTFLPLVHEDDLEVTANALRDTARPPYTSSYEQRAMTKDGWRWFAWSGTAVLDDNQNVTAIISVGRDITERKNAEEELQKSEEMYRILVDNAAESLVVAQDGMLRFVNPKAEEDTGYSAAELMSVPFLELIHPEDRALVGLNHQRRMRGEPMEDTYHFRILRKDGSPKWVEVHAVLIPWQGAPATLNFMTDITERKQAEEKLALNFETQAAMNALLGLSLESRTINEFLDRSLDLVLSLKWLAVESKGAIFLADKAGETLHLRVHKGLPKDLSAICSTVPFGRCMCGRAAAARAVQFADRVDERHDTRYEGMLPHGHYCVPVLSGDHILGVINLYVKEGHTRSPWEEDFLKAVANTLAGTIERRRAEESLTETHEKLRQSWESTILVLASMAEMRDPYTAGHQQRVSELAQAIAQELGLPEAQVEGIRVAGLLHDLGKIQIPAEILSKPGKLTSIELMMIRTHSQAGYEILKSTVFPWPIAQFVLQHHERWDGSGYPAGLKGEEILLEARILAVADVVEAMSSHRPYRPAFGVPEALWEILQNKGTLYDAAVAEACQRVFEERQFRFRSQVG